MFSAADRVVVPHLQKGPWLHDWFHYYVVQTFDIDNKKNKNFEYFDVAVTFCLNWMSARNMLFVVCFLHCRRFYDLNLYFFYMYCENMPFYDNSYFLFSIFLKSEKVYLMNILWEIKGSFC